MCLQFLSLRKAFFVNWPSRRLGFSAREQRVAFSALKFFLFSSPCQRLKDLWPAELWFREHEHCPFQIIMKIFMFWIVMRERF